MTDVELERERLLHLHHFENDARERGFTFVAGIDEVGRGPLAGPVVAACVVTEHPLMVAGLDDSKRVTPQRRIALEEIIKAKVASWAIGEASVGEIDELRIARASMLAMERALAALPKAPEYLLSDAFRVHAFAGEQHALIKGDTQCATIAAASILAKVHRDRLLIELDAKYPQYGFADHKGYGTARHLTALRKHGPCAAHRYSWAPVRSLALPLL
jgi:ribonuclease HII